MSDDREQESWSWSKLEKERDTVPDTKTLSMIFANQQARIRIYPCQEGGFFCQRDARDLESRD